MPTLTFKLADFLAVRLDLSKKRNVDILHFLKSIALSSWARNEIALLKEVA